MNENKVIYYVKLIGRMIVAVMCWLVLALMLWQVQDLSILIKAILLIGLLGAMFLNIYNGKENRYYDFKQPIDNLSKLDEGSFIYFIERLYRTLGYFTKIPFKCQTNGLKKAHEIVLCKDNKQIIMHCYNQKEISIGAVQQLVGSLSNYPKDVHGQLLMIGKADERVKQLAKLNAISIIEDEMLEAQMLEAAHVLECDLDGAISAFWCHPFKWFRKHFLEAEPRFMNEKTWLDWVKLELKNRDYKVNTTEDPEEYGAQLVVERDGESIAIKCIGIDNKVKVTDLYALKASIPFYEVDKALIITNSRVCHNECSLAKHLKIEILNFDDFMKWLKLQDKKQEAETTED